MADNSNTILNQLQDFSITAPDKAFDNAWAAIIATGAIAANSAVTYNIQMTDNTAASSNESAIFSQLQHYESADMPAPEFNFEVIKKSLKSEPREKSSSNTPIFAPLFYKAAAVVLIAAGATLYYLLSGNNKNQQNNTVTGSTNPSVITPSKTINADSVTNTTKENTAVKRQDTPAVEKLTVTHKRKSISPNRNTIALKEKRKTHKTGKLKDVNKNQFTDNDVLMTLVNYKMLGRDDLYTKAMAEKKVTLNEYSYLNLSDKMVELLQNMYLTKRNGKPSRKAKKTKARFEKWKKKDEDFFDKDFQKNPVDIIDLSEFIF